MSAAVLAGAGRRQSASQRLALEVGQKLRQHHTVNATLSRWAPLPRTSLRSAWNRTYRPHKNRGSATYRNWQSLLVPGACLLLSSCLWSSSADPVHAEGRWLWPFGQRNSKSPFDDPRVRKAKRQRARANKEMKAYVDKMRVPVQELMDDVKNGKVTEKEFAEQMRALSDEVQATTQRIIYGVKNPPDARRRYEAEYGYCRATPEALQVVATLSPLVEICAGKGHWQRALSEVGATVVAYDGGGNPHPYSGDPAPVGTVFRGKAEALRLHRDKTLLLVYPPAGNDALRCLQEYYGDQFVYVGEGRGGVNANDDFFNKLDAEWEATTVLELDPFPQCFERLFVLRRRRVSSATTVGEADNPASRAEPQQQKAEQ